MSKKILFIDPIGGLSGDMFLGAFLDLGLPLKKLSAGLEKVGLNCLFELEAETTARHQIAARKIGFSGLQEGLVSPAPKTLFAVEKFLASSSLSAQIVDFALNVFTLLAESEAEVHGTTREKVHFHEVGDYDTIADIVGVAIAIEWLKPECINFKPIPLGSGQISCAHGMLPVPVPAVMSLLKGLPTYESGIQAELVTPTGAAILKTLVKKFPRYSNEVYTLGRSGYGAGSRDLLEKANLLRLTSGFSEDMTKSADNLPFALEKIVTLETMIDDMSPEKLAYLKDSLLAKGVLDVVSWPLFMKKGRLGNNLMVLLRADLEEKIVKAIFAESSTLGIRRFVGERYYLERENRKYMTSYGEINCKIARDKSGAVVNLKPEHDDLARLAKSHSVPLTCIEQSVLAELLNSQLLSQSF